MIFKYNMYFEISSLIILLIVFAHTNFKKTIASFRNKFFVFFTWVGVLDILFDLISTVLISNPDVYSPTVQQLSLQILYLMQLTLPFMLYLYVLYIRDPALEKVKINIGILAVPYVIMVLAVIGNPWLKLFYSFDEQNVYTREWFYPSMYIYALCFLVLCLLDTIIFRKKVPFRNAMVIWEFAIISGIAVAVQMVYNDVLLTGFGIAASIIIILLTLQNPSENIDTLTRAYDINGFREKLTILRKSKAKIWLVVISIDNLKRINHVFGMEAGDQILIRIVKMLEDVAGEDNVFRFLGDRFAVTLYSEKQYHILLKECDEYFSDLHKINNTDYRLSACICMDPNDIMESEPNQLLAFIDYFILQAKTIGPGTKLEMSDELMKKYRRHRRIEEFLYEAIEKDLFTVNFQPIYSSKEGRFVSIESLARLNHPELGDISPSEFIPIAEKSGQVTAVGRCVLKRVCMFLEENREVLNKIKTVKFNISPTDLMNANLADNILARIREHDIDPKVFQFEITETAATLYISELTKLVAQIKDAGCGICLDDFGSGYANLDAVVQLPFDVIKMDKSMLNAAMETKKAEALYHSMIEVMNNLNYVVVAEGAETEAQVRYLRHIGVDLIQGYYYSRPLPPEKLLEFLNIKN